LGQMTNRVFIASVALLSAFWEAGATPGDQAGGGSGGSEQDMLSAWILGQLARLQFCRMRLTAYSDLLKAVLATCARSQQVLSHLSADHLRFVS
jgi:hypothetical protein